jgi:hypothetical protein
MNTWFNKLFKIVFTGIIVVAAMILITGCDSFTVTGKKYPALADDALVQVIMRAVPDYKVEQIGILSTECFSEKDCIVKAQKVARKNGGDVIVLSQAGIKYYDNTPMQLRIWEICKIVMEGKKK